MLRARPAGPAPLRPPWAAPDDARFTTVCTRCGECIAACPPKVLRVGDGGYPVIDFSQAGCTLCGACLPVCAPGALSRAGAARPWSLQARFGEACLAARRVECRVCGESCDERAIRFPPLRGGVARPVLDAERCTGCGQCVAPCPTDAIRMAPAEA